MGVSPYGKTVWRDYETDGVPASGPHLPLKSDIRAWAASVEGQFGQLLGSQEIAQGAGGGTFATATAGLTINTSNQTQDVGLLINSQVNTQSAIDIYLHNGTSRSAVRGQALRLWTSSGDDVSLTGSISGGVLTVTEITGTLVPNMQLFDTAGLLANNTIVGTQISGTTGGVGTYNVTPAQTVASEAMTAAIFSVPLYVDNSGTIYSRTGAVWSGTFTTPQSPGVTATIEIPENTFPFFNAVWSDIAGPCYIYRPIAQDATPGSMLLMGKNGAGAFVWNLANDGTIGWGPPTNTGYSASSLGLDTFFGRGNAPAILQPGGPDNNAPAAQYLAAPSAHAPAWLIALPSAASQDVLQYNYNLSGQVPRTIFAGDTVTDPSTAGAIQAGTTVSVINNGSATFTLSQNIAGAGVQNSDALLFSTPNTPGADLIVAGGRGTGSGRGGRARLQVAPASASASGTGSISGTTLTLTTSTINGAFQEGHVIIGSGVKGGTIIVSGPTISGSNTLFTVNQSQTVSSTTISTDSSGINQNVWVDYLIVDPEPAAGYAPVQILGAVPGGTVQQLSLASNANSGSLTGGFGMANGGGRIVTFNGGGQGIGIGGGIFAPNSGFFGWTGYAAVDTPANDTQLSRASAGVVSFDTGALGNAAATLKGASLQLGTSVSAAAWAMNGIRHVNPAAVFTDTSSAGTVAAACTDLFGIGTIDALSATTYTSYYGSYFKAPAAGSNVTFTHSYALGADSIFVSNAAKLPDNSTWDSGGINGAIIGATTPEAGHFTSLSATGTITSTQTATGGPTIAQNGQAATVVANGSNAQLGLLNLGYAFVYIAETTAVGASALVLITNGAVSIVAQSGTLFQASGSPTSGHVGIGCSGGEYFIYNNFGSSCSFKVLSFLAG